MFTNCGCVLNTSRVPDHNPTRNSAQCQEEFTNMSIKTRLNTATVCT